MPSDVRPYDALLLVSFGGPEQPDDVLPFLENVTRGRGIPDERLEAVAEHYHHFGGVSPIYEQNKALIPRLYKAYAEAAKWLTANPDEAAKLITPKSTPADQAALAASIRANSRLGLSLASADEVRKEIQAVYKAGMESGFLPQAPSDASIYGGPVK